MITVGADPELFLSRDGSFVSAHSVVPGTKEEPFEVFRGALQVDGVAAEINIKPAKTYKEFQNNLDTVLGTLKHMTPGYEFLKDVTVELTPEYRETLPASAVTIGCNADSNAYTADLNLTPDGNTPFRSAGGHIHIGGVFPPDSTGRERYALAVRLTRLMDKYVGVYSVLWDPDTKRRQIYGQAGAFRMKDYGIEYRSLSNQWIFDPALTKFVYEATMKAVEALYRGEDNKEELYRSIINQSDATNEFFMEDSTAAFVKTLRS